MTPNGKLVPKKEIESEFNNILIYYRELLDSMNLSSEISHYVIPVVRYKEPNINILNIYHHIGIYAFSKSVLSKYVKLSRTKNEIDRKLEQMRALDNNIEIKVALSKSLPLGIDTEEDFLLIKKSMEYKG